MKHISNALGLLALMGLSSAQASGFGLDFGNSESTTYGTASINAVVTDIYSDNDNPQLIGQKMTVNINPTGAAIGQPNAYYVGVGINGGSMVGEFTAEGWKPYVNGLYEPIAATTGSPQSFAIFDGSLTICQAVSRLVMQNGGGIGNVGDVQFYAGNGYLSPDQQNQIATYYSKASTVPTENLQIMFAQQEMLQDKNYQQVYSTDCSVGN